MRFMLLVCTDPEAEPYREAEDNFAEWDQTLEAQGILAFRQRLRPPEDATTVRVRRDEVLLTDGPFAETKEGVAGVAILECRDRDHAVELASRHPMARFGRIEVREFWSFGDPPAIPPGTADAPDGYLMFVCNDPDAEPYRAELDNIHEWAAEVERTGHRTHGDRLQPPEKAVTVKVRRGQVLVSDGPFAETKESIAGYDVILCPHLDTALAIAARHPMARFGRIEVRPFWPRP